MRVIKVFDSHEDFLKREDKTVAGVSKAFARHRPDYLDVFDPERHGGTWNFLIDRNNCIKCCDKELSLVRLCSLCHGAYAVRIEKYEGGASNA